jgi:hypothetical protein
MSWGGVRVVARLGAPVHGNYAIHLDGLLAEVTFRRMRGPVEARTRQTPIDVLVDLPVPLTRIRARDSWLWASSAWMLSDDAEHYADYVIQRKDTEDIERLVLPWTPGSGPGRNRMLRSIVTVARETSWLAVGDRREIKKALALLNDALGGRRRHGMGRVLEWRVESCDVDPIDCLVSRDGQAMRHLPVAWCREVGGAVLHGGWQPPYWHPGLHGPIVAPGAMVRLHDDVIAAAHHPVRW